MIYIVKLKIFLNFAADVIFSCIKCFSNRWLSSFFFACLKFRKFLVCNLYTLEPIIFLVVILMLLKLLLYLYPFVILLLKVLGVPSFFAVVTLSTYSTLFTIYFIEAEIWWGKKIFVSIGVIWKYFWLEVALRFYEIYFLALFILICLRVMLFCFCGLVILVDNFFF